MSLNDIKVASPFDLELYREKTVEHVILKVNKIMLSDELRTEAMRVSVLNNIVTYEIPIDLKLSRNEVKMAAQMLLNAGWGSVDFFETVTYKSPLSVEIVPLVYTDGPVYKTIEKVVLTTSTLRVPHYG